MLKQIKNDLGTIFISKDVIAAITGISAMECYGLVGMSSRNVKDGISELLGRDNLSKGIEVEIKGDKVLISINIIVEYGIKVSEVAHNVIDKVKFTLKEMLDLENVDIHVNIQSIRVSNIK